MRLAFHTSLLVSTALCMVALTVSIRMRWISTDTALLYFTPAWCGVAALLIATTALRRASELLAWAAVLAFAIAFTLQPALMQETSRSFFQQQ